MEKYRELVMGMISGIALIFLNSDLVSRTLTHMINFFVPQVSNRINITLCYYVSIIMIILSFMGICITITCSFLILKRIMNEIKR